MFKVELKKSVSWNPATSSQMFYSHGQLTAQDPKPLLTLSWGGWTPQLKKCLCMNSFAFSFLFLLLVSYFDFSPFQYSHVAKINNSLQIHPMGLVPRKMLQMSVETRHGLEAAVVCCSCISAEVGCEEQFRNLWGENEVGQLKVLWFPHLFCSCIYGNHGVEFVAEHRGNRRKKN